MPRKELYGDGAFKSIVVRTHDPARIGRSFEVFRRNGIARAPQLRGTVVDAGRGTSVEERAKIIGKVAEVFVTAYPNPFAPSRRSFEHLSVAREIMKSQRHVFGVGQEAGFDEVRFVITNAYTGGSDNLKKTFDQAPKHRDDRANELCRRELDYQRGDDFLQIACLDLASARKYLLREVPRDSLPAIVYQIAFLAVGRIVLPLFHWLNSREPMRDLRARKSQ